MIQAAPAYDRAPRRQGQARAGRRSSTTTSTTSSTWPPIAPESRRGPRRRPDRRPHVRGGPRVPQGADRRRHDARRRTADRRQPGRLDSTSRRRRRRPPYAQQGGRAVGDERAGARPRPTSTAPRREGAQRLREKATGKLVGFTPAGKNPVSRVRHQPGASTRSSPAIRSRTALEQQPGSARSSAHEAVKRLTLGLAGRAWATLPEESLEQINPNGTLNIDFVDGPGGDNDIVTRDGEPLTFDLDRDGKTRDQRSPSASSTTPALGYSQAASEGISSLAGHVHYSGTHAPDIDDLPLPEGLDNDNPNTFEKVMAWPFDAEGRGHDLRRRRRGRRPGRSEVGRRRPGLPFAGRDRRGQDRTDATSASTKGGGAGVEERSMAARRLTSITPSPRRCSAPPAPAARRSAVRRGRADEGLRADPHGAAREARRRRRGAAGGDAALQPERHAKHRLHRRAEQRQRRGARQRRTAPPARSSPGTSTSNNGCLDRPRRPKPTIPRRSRASSSAAR